MEIRNIVIASSVIALVAVTVLAAPFLGDASQRQKRQSAGPELTRDAHANRLSVEYHLVSMQRDPLYWECQSASLDRARYFRDTCFGEHVIEFSLGPERGEVQLLAHGDAFFTSALEARVAGTQGLSSAQIDTIRSMLSRRLPRLPTARDEWQAPEYTSAIEACLDGRPYFVARRAWSDEEFESLASDLVAATGVKLARTRPANCI